MPFYEITFETGRSSIAFYENDDEAKSALKNHHDRALNGEPGGPIGAPAERIAKVRVYSKHPNEFNPSQGISKDVAAKELAALVDDLADENGVVAIDQLAVEVRALTHPMVKDAEKGSTFDSNFLMKEDKSLDMAFLGGAK